MSRCTRSLPILAAFCTAVLGAAWALHAPPTRAAAPSPAPPKIRIGVYDSRVVPLAFINSDMGQAHINKLMDEAKKAEAAGDTARLEKLKQQGTLGQMRLHLQGFSNAPVDDLLEFVKDKLPQLARENNLVAIVPKTDFAEANVEIVDITEKLAELYSPNERGEKYIKDLVTRKPKPMDIAQVATMKEED